MSEPTATETLSKEGELRDFDELMKIADKTEAVVAEAGLNIPEQVFVHGASALRRIATLPLHSPIRAASVALLKELLQGADDTLKELHIDPAAPRDEEEREDVNEEAEAEAQIDRLLARAAAAGQPVDGARVRAAQRRSRLAAKVLAYLAAVENVSDSRLGRLGVLLAGCCELYQHAPKEKLGAVRGSIANLTEALDHIDEHRRAEEEIAAKFSQAAAQIMKEMEDYIAVAKSQVQAEGQAQPPAPDPQAQ